MSTISVQTQQVNKFIQSALINIYQVELNVGLSAVVYMYDSQGNQVDTQSVRIEGDDYQQWTDDNALQILILSKCGLVPQF